MNHYAITAKKRKLGMIILYVVTNDLKSGRTPCEIAGKINNLAKNLKTNPTKVATFDLVARNDSKEANKAIAVNEELR